MPGERRVTPPVKLNSPRVEYGVSAGDHAAADRVVDDAKKVEALILKEFGGVSSFTELEFRAGLNNPWHRCRETDGFGGVFAGNSKVSTKILGSETWFRNPRQPEEELQFKMVVTGKGESRRVALETTRATALKKVRAREAAPAAKAEGRESGKETALAARTRIINKCRAFRGVDSLKVRCFDGETPGVWYQVKDISSTTGKVTIVGANLDGFPNGVDIWDPRIQFVDEHVKHYSDDRRGRSPDRRSVEVKK